MLFVLQILQIKYTIVVDSLEFFSNCKLMKCIIDNECK